MLQVIFHYISRFGVARSSGTVAGLERRQSHRLYASLPLEFRFVRHNRPVTFAARSLMKNISRGGAYLTCSTRPDSADGEVGYVDFKSPTVHLAAKAIIRRQDRHPDSQFSFGLAVEFLSGPLIFY